jgi:group I intron endonuclease
MENCGVYQIRNILDNNVYIGSAINIKRRWRDHKRELRNNIHRNPHLQYSWNKYGENCFLFEVLEEVIDKSNLINREQYHLDNLNPSYNVCKIAYSRGGTKHSEETKKKISLSRIGIPSPMKGKHHSYETKKKISKANTGNTYAKGSIRNKEWKEKQRIAHLGKKLSEETKKKMSEKQKGNMAFLGKKHSEETKKKMSESHKNISDETRNKMIASHIGKRHSEETKKKISQSRRK